MSPTADAADDEQTGSGQPPRPKQDPNNRPDVTALCDLMVDLVTANGCRRPTITKAWRDDARLLLDKDGRDLDDALTLMRWAAADPFWRANVRSLPKFREQYDQLRLRSGQPAAAPRPTRSDVAVASFIGMAQDRRARHNQQQQIDRPDRPDRPQLPASGGLF